MPKIDPLTDLANLQSETTAVSAINANNTKIEEAVANTISRDGSAPNAMEANLDLGTNRIINVGAPVDNTDAVRYVDLVEATGALTAEDLALIAAAPGHAQDAEDAAEAAAQSAIDASNYIGAATSAARWSTGRTITTTGDVTGVSAAWDGSANISFALSIPALSITNAKLAVGAAVANIGYTPANTAGVVDAPTATGFRGMPVNSQPNTYVPVADDCGRTILHTSGVGGHALAIYPIGTVPFVVGDCFTYINDPFAASVIAAPQPGVSLYWAGSGLPTGNRTLAPGAWAVFTMTGNDVWMVTGAGIS